MENIAKQSEVLLLWDGENWNPNGDILNDNAPRYDDISGLALVTDVRVKRTIRDDLFERKGREIFVRETKSLKGGLNDGKARVKELTDNKDVVKTIIDKCIDVRAFGGVFPVEGQQNSLTGALQFKMSKSIHKVGNPVFIKGTGAFASKEGKNNDTFREEYILPYAMFATYGVVSEKSAKVSNFINDDYDEVIDSLWIGTKSLITRSKIGQMPRILIKINYNSPGFFIGDLNNRIKIKNLIKPDEVEIRSINDFEIDLSELIELTEKYKSKISSVEYRFDDSVDVAVGSDWIKI